MLIFVENRIFNIDNFSKNSSNFIRIFGSGFGLGFFMTRPKKTSNILSELINKQC
jgi:hypothetical protein